MPRASALKSILSNLTRGGKQAEQQQQDEQQQQQQQQVEHAKAAAAASTQAVFLTAVAADASVGAGQVRTFAESWWC